jgi:hypothetical protein
LLVAAPLWATLELVESRRLLDWSLYGLLWGFALLTNPAVAQRFVDFWTGTATPLAAFRQADSLWLRFILLCNDAAPLCALLGIVVLLATKNTYALPVISVPALFPLLYYVTHTSLRYRHPIDPVILLLAAIGVHGLWRWAHAQVQPQAQQNTSRGIFRPASTNESSRRVARGAPQHQRGTIDFQP